MTLSAALTIEILGEKSFGALAGEWDALVPRSFDNRIFLTPTWHRVWWERYGSGEAYLLTARGPEDTLVGILPVTVHDDGNERVLTLTGDPEVTDYMDALADRDGAEEIVRSLWEHALDQLEWDRLLLRHVSSVSPSVTAIAEALGETQVTSEQDEVMPVAELRDSWDDYLQTLGKKPRHEIRRKLRRATSDAVTEWKIVATPEELEVGMTEFFRLHALSARDKAAFMTDPMQEFFRALGRAFLREGALRLGTFTRDGQAIASTISFLHNGHYLLYNSGYDPEYAAHSPGIAAVAFAMQDAIENRARIFDFLSGDEPYKYQFGATNTSSVRIIASRDRS